MKKSRFTEEQMAFALKQVSIPPEFSSEAPKYDSPDRPLRQSRTDIRFSEDGLVAVVTVRGLAV